MQPADTWLSITIQLPYLAAIFTGLILLLLIVAGVIWLIRRYRRQKADIYSLQAQVDDLIRRQKDIEIFGCDDANGG